MRTIRRGFLNSDKTQSAMFVLDADDHDIRLKLSDCDRQISLDFSIYSDTTRQDRLDKLDRIQGALDALRRHLKAVPNRRKPK